MTNHMFDFALTQYLKMDKSITKVRQRVFDILNFVNVVSLTTMYSYQSDSNKYLSYFLPSRLKLALDLSELLGRFSLNWFTVKL